VRCKEHVFYDFISINIKNKQTKYIVLEIENYPGEERLRTFGALGSWEYSLVVI
jgi:hypothetical protein